MKQLKITNTIWFLIKILFRHGNVQLFYHCIGGAKDVPMEVEQIEIRNTLLGNKVTIF